MCLFFNIVKILPKGWRLGDECILFAISYQLSAISYQLSAISYQLSAISYQLSVIQFHIPLFWDIVGSRFLNSRIC